MNATAVEQESGILVVGNKIHVDLSTPRMFMVTARNPYTNLTKEYILKVTHNGLCLA